MSLKRQLQSLRSKRLSNVSDNLDSKSEDMNSSSTDSDIGETRKQRKVRKKFSVEDLIKKRENYKVDDDHVYSIGKAHGEWLDDARTRKRRKISETSDDKPVKQRCSSRNAVMARLNRERKKIYVSSLETENMELRKEKDKINEKIQSQDMIIAAMKQEILYLRGLLANSKELGQLLQNLKTVTNLPVTSSILSASTHKEDKSRNESNEYHPIHKTFKFPLLNKDINLGSISDRSVFDFDNSLFDFESNLYETSLSDPSFDLNLGNYDFDDVDNTFLNVNDGLSKMPTDMGICVHLNTKRISVEVCSICNKKANSAT